MAEEFQKYKDILKREQVQEAAGERGKDLEILFIAIKKIGNIELNKVEIL